MPHFSAEGPGRPILAMALLVGRSGMVRDWSLVIGMVEEEWGVIQNRGG